ncbi:MAG TPA: hypothetical protein ACFCUC_02800 [Desulfobacterales bacterium]
MPKEEKNEIWQKLYIELMVKYPPDVVKNELGVFRILAYQAAVLVNRISRYASNEKCDQCHPIAHRQLKAAGRYRTFIYSYHSGDEPESKLLCLLFGFFLDFLGFFLHSFTGFLDCLCGFFGGFIDFFTRLFRRPFLFTGHERRHKNDQNRDDYSFLLEHISSLLKFTYDVDLSSRVKEHPRVPRQVGVQRKQDHQRRKKKILASSQAAGNSSASRMLPPRGIGFFELHRQALMPAADDRRRQK